MATKWNRQLRSRRSPEDLVGAETSVIHFSQKETFHDEFMVLSSGRGEVRKDSSIYKLDPILDNGLLRVGGRLSKPCLRRQNTQSSYLKTKIYPP